MWRTTKNILAVLFLCMVSLLLYRAVLTQLEKLHPFFSIENHITVTLLVVSLGVFSLFFRHWIIGEVLHTDLKVQVPEGFFSSIILVIAESIKDTQPSIKSFFVRRMYMFLSVMFLLFFAWFLIFDLPASCYLLMKVWWKKRKG